MCVYLCAKFEVSSLILTSFGQGWVGVGEFYPPPQNEPLKSPPRLRLKGKGKRITDNSDN